MGAEPDAAVPSSSSCAIIGGLVASGDGPCAPSAFGGRNDDDPGENRLSEPLALKPKPVVGVDVDGGLDAEGVGSGGAPELNSAHLGHFRFVSEGDCRSANEQENHMTKIQLTHMPHLTAMSASPLYRVYGVRRLTIYIV